MNAAWGNRYRLSLDGWTMLALFALLVGSVLRLWNLGEPSISHPEIYFRE